MTGMNITGKGWYSAPANSVFLHGLVRFPYVRNQWQACRLL